MKGQPQMKKTLLAAAAGLATLVFAGNALAANTATIAASHAPMSSGASGATTLHINIPQATDPIAVITIFVPTGYTANLSGAPGTSIGTVEATAFSRTNNLTLPLSGSVSTANPASFTAQSTRCAQTPNSAAVWVLNLTVAGQAIALPVYVNPTSGAQTALGAYKMSVCLAPPDIPESQGGAAQGAQVLDTKFTVNGIFTTPSTAGVSRWESLFTPYNPGRGTPNLAGTFEARSLTGIPATLGLGVKYNKKTKRYVASGKAAEGGAGVAGATVTLLRGLSATKQTKVGAAKTSAAGTFTLPGKLAGKRPFFFKATVVVPERDGTATGCTTPLPPTLAPAGCVSATLPAWTASSKAVRVKP
jgi:hypothetical protein